MGGAGGGESHRFWFLLLHLRIIQNYNRLNGITVNGIKLNQIYQSQITLLYLRYVSSSFVGCYHSVIVISLGLAQSEPIKGPLL